MGGEEVYVPQLKHVCWTFCDFAELYRRSFSTNHSQTWQLRYFLAPFQRCRQIVINSSLCQNLKKTVERSIRPYNVFQKLNRSWNNHDEVERLSNIFIRNNDGNDNVKKHNFLQKVYEGLY